ELGGHALGAVSARLLDHSEMREQTDERGRHADFHSFRYTFCEQLAVKLPIQIVKKMMRHLTLQMTADLYGDLELEDIAEDVWQLSPFFPVEDRHGGAKVPAYNLGPV